MPIKLDFSGVTEEGLEPIAPGVYEANVYNVTNKIGKDSGKPYLEFEFSLPTEQNRRVWSNYSLTPQALWKLKSVLLKLGFDAKQLAGDFDLEPSEILGRKCRVKLKIEEYQGKPNNTVDDVLEVEFEEASDAVGRGVAKKKNKVF